MYFYKQSVNIDVLKKNLVRKTFLEKRRNLSKENLISFEKRVIDKTISLLNEIKPTTIHCFLSIKNKNEINTQPIIDFCFSNNIRVVVPKSDFNTRNMISIELSKESKIVVNQYNIPEPINGNEIASNEISLVITPLLGFDLKGFRVGYGKGFYDNFFRECNPNIVKVGISLFEAITTIEDSESHDVKLSHCITPSSIHLFE